MESRENILRDILNTRSTHIIGVDEVGLGAWAGPLVVTSVVAKRGWAHPDVKDSKAYKGKNAHVNRARGAYWVHNECCSVSSVITPADTISELGLKSSLVAATKQVIRDGLVGYEDSVVVVDGSDDGTYQNVVSEFNAMLFTLPKADALVPAVSAASVVAKHRRDLIMKDMDCLYPGYGFNTNVGYGTPKHREGLSKLGVCPIHRTSYTPVKRYM